MSKQVVAKAVGWQSFEVATQIGLYLAYIGVTARYLSEADFGVFAIVQGCTAASVLVVQGTFGAALVQVFEVNRRQMTGALQLSCLTGLTIFGLMWFASQLIESCFMIEGVRDLLRFSALQVIFLSVSNICLYALHIRMEFKNLALTSILSNVCGYSLGIAFALNSLGVWALVLGTVTISGMKALTYLWISRRSFLVGIYISHAISLIRFGSHMLLLGVVNYLTSSGYVLFLSRFMTVESLGTFERATQLRLLPATALGQVVDSVSYPLLAKYKEDKNTFRQSFEYFLACVSDFTLPVTMFLCYFSSELVFFLMGSGWSNLVQPLQLLFLTLPLLASGRLVDVASRATNNLMANLQRKLVFLFSLVFLALFLVPTFSFKGAALSFLLASIFSFILSIRLAAKITVVSEFQILRRCYLSGFKSVVVCTIALVSIEAVSYFYSLGDIFVFVASAIGVIVWVSWGVMIQPEVLGRDLAKLISRGGV